MVKTAHHSHGDQAHGRDAAADLARTIGVASAVLLHACVAFMHVRLDRLVWPVQEQPGSSTIDWLFWCLRGFAVPLLCFLSGWFAAESLAAKGAGPFLRNRFGRLAIPLLVGTLTILPIMYLVWATGWVRRGWAGWENVLHIRFGPAVQPNLYGFAHLWFLRDVLLCCGLLALFARLGLWRSTTAPGPRSAIAAWGATLATATLAVAAFDDALLSFRNGFVPRPGFFLFHAAFFFAGACRLPMPAGRIEIARNLLCAAVLLPALVALIARHRAEALSPFLRIVLGTTASLYAGLMLTAVLGLSRQAVALLNARGRQWLQQASDRSLWLYAAHLPFLGLSVVATYTLEIPIGVKFLLAALAGFAGPLALEPLVRGTKLGAAFGLTRR